MTFFQLNVGIGMSSPDRKLDVLGTTRIETGTTFDFTNDRFRIDGGTGVGTTGLLEIRQSGNTHNDGIAISSSHARAHRIWKHSDGSLNFGTSGNRHVTFTTGGYVGVGIASPARKLDVIGTTRIETGTTFDFTADRLRINGGTGVGTTGLLEIRQSGNTHNDGIAISSSHASAHRIWKHSDGSLNFGTTLNRHVVFTTTGNVGIGTDDPQSELAVNGQIRATEVKVLANIDVPDYVFESDYILPTLKEIKEYIDKNKHLPEIPSAAEIGKNGIDLGDMNMRLLKKIEELTLYQIEMLEQLENQQEEINILKAKINLNK